MSSSVFLLSSFVTSPAYALPAVGLGAISEGDIVISEIHMRPAARQAEWFEVYNRSSVRVDLQGLEVTDGASESFTVTSSVTIAPGEFTLFSTETSTAIPSVDVLYSESDFPLGDRADTIVLSYGGTEFDRVAYSGGADFPQPYGASIALDPDFFDSADNDDGYRWCKSLEVYGSSNMGSPGTANEDCPRPLQDLVAGDLVITELMIDPKAVSDLRGEWLEIINTTPEEINLKGLVVTDSSGGSFTISSSLCCSFFHFLLSFS